MQLARAAGKTAHKFLRARGLQQADRDDVIGAAMLWCWEHKDSYSLTTTLETWFMNAVRDAYKDLQRNELPTSDESLEEMGGADTTYETAAADSAADALMRALTPVDKRIAVLLQRGYTYEEMVEAGHSRDTINAARKRIRQLTKLLPEEQHTKRSTQTAAKPPSDDAEETMSNIDKEIEKLDFSPPAGKDCPPCWRCMYFEGFMPAGARDTRLEIADKDVRVAVAVTEARKIEIAQQVRSGING